MMGHNVKLIGAILVLGTAGVGCAGATATQQQSVTAPHVVGFANYAASIGTPISVYGTNFLSFNDTGYATQLVFSGTFRAVNGQSEAVHVQLPVRFMDSGTVEWTSFGPYANPMGLSAPQVGTFHGTIAAQVVDSTGVVVATDTEPSTFDFSIQPSVAIQTFQPTMASCVGPIQRALAGAPYHLQVAALGFTPRSFTYTVSVPGITTINPITITHMTSNPSDDVGLHNELVLPEMPAGLFGYDMVVEVSAIDTDGAEHQTAFAMGVHNPIEIFYNGNVQIAQTYAPVVVSSCIPGGAESRSVSYDETVSETRSRTLSSSWDNNWVQMHTVTDEQSHSGSTTHEMSSSNTVDVSTTDGTNWGWSYENGTNHTDSTSFNASGGVGIGPFFLGGGGDHGWMDGTTSSSGTNGGGSHMQTVSNSRTQGLSVSETSTDTTSVSTSNSASVGRTQGGMESMEVSSSTSTARMFSSYIPANEYGVFYRQTTRLVRQGLLVTYNLCGVSTVVGQADFSDWAWAPDLANAPSCPPLPVSNLPPAHCYVSPCDN